MSEKKNIHNSIWKLIFLENWKKNDLSQQFSNFVSIKCFSETLFQEKQTLKSTFSTQLLQNVTIQ